MQQLKITNHNRYFSQTRIEAIESFLLPFNQDHFIKIMSHGFMGFMINKIWFEIGIL